MNNTTYNNKRILSPLQPRIQPVIDIRNENHPAREIIRKLCTTSHNLKITFEEDVSTLDHFRHIPGFIAILCKFTKDGQTIAFGRSCSVFSRMNKQVERTISSAINGSFLSAANNATKVFEALRMSQPEEETGQKFEEMNNQLQYRDDPASSKQKSYLLQLIDSNVENEDERDQLKSEVDRISKEKASEMIEGFLNNNTINY